jgi:hypothetical protein
MLVAPLLWAQEVRIHQAPLLNMPGVVDSNSPVFWRDGMLHIINSTGMPRVTVVPDQFSFEEGEVIGVSVDTQEHFPMWIESVWQDEDGTLFAWYHHERVGVCKGSSLTMPEIGALVSLDGGSSYLDLGIVLAAGEAPDCSSQNGFFAGGHGDFSVIADPIAGYFYFLFDNYGGPAESQGVAVARMAMADRYQPAGAVFKYYQGDWNEPGVGGRVTPIFPSTVPWNRADTDSFWGPSVHWNSAINSYVVLLNRACCGPRWPQEGIYISFNPDLANPESWTRPERLLSAEEIGFAPGYYPQVIGLGPGETDTLAGNLARLYVKGASKWELEFIGNSPPAGAPADSGSPLQKDPASPNR